MDAAGTGDGGSAREHRFAGRRKIPHSDEGAGRRVFYSGGGVQGGERAGAAGLHVGLGEGRQRNGVWRGGGKALAGHGGVSKTGRGDGDGADGQPGGHGGESG